MALVAPVENGKVIDTSSPTTSVTSKPNDSLDKNAFLQLLVAEMQNQDPLEPTTNTEYVSQLATFSSLEEMQNVAKAMDFSRASGLVGQEVYVKTTNASTGSTDYIHGNVDYITYENGKSFVHVNGGSYPLEDVDSIYDTKYSNAYDGAVNWTVALNKLPAERALTLNDAENVFAVYDALAKMSPYEQSFITKENVDKIQSLSDKIDAMMFTSMVNSMPAPEDLTEKNSEQFETLKKAYESLNTGTRGKVESSVFDRYKAIADAMGNLGNTETVKPKEENADDGESEVKSGDE